MHELFQEPDDWEDIYIGVKDLFDEKYINQRELDENLNKKKSNQLYSFFNMPLVNTQPIKRKTSSGGVECNLKLRRMSIDQVASPALRPRVTNQRPMAATVSSPTSTKRMKKMARRRLLPGQKLLSSIWGKRDTDED